MPVSIFQQKICFIRLAISPDEVPGLLVSHREDYPDASGVEEQGVRTIGANFEPVKAIAFVERVVRWGKGQRFVDRLLAENTADQISTALRDANELLASGATAAAVSRLQKLRFLGQSFASKVARFLSPDTAVILDDVIRSALGYRESQDGYQEFLDDCQTSLKLLSPHHPRLRICDVEAAIFAKIRKK